MILACVASIS